MNVLTSKYTINVARATGHMLFGGTKPQYAHYVTVYDEFSTEKQITEITKDLKQRFPEPDFKVELARWECVGTSIEVHQ